MSVWADGTVSTISWLVASTFTPACGYVAVLFSERVKRIGGTLQGARIVRDLAPGLLDSVLAHRADVVIEARLLLERSTA